MCAIIGSRKLDKLKELVSLNSYRGSHSYSLSLFNTYSGHLTVLKKKLGTIDLNNFIIPHHGYAIVHVQAPTTDSRTDAFIHPAITGGETYPEEALWHNGIIKEEQVKENISKYNTSWDTMQLLKGIVSTKSFKVLNDFDGTFSCLYYSKEDLCLRLFRNEISPMFIDSEMNISSTKFENSFETASNSVIKLNLNKNSIIIEDEFVTVENPYFFGD
jgi:hypothetical protein